jgi:hypothetical protein
MSLVWLGHSIEELRRIRSSTIGTERASDSYTREQDIHAVTGSMCDMASLPPRLQKVIARYAQDLLGMASQIARVLRRNGQATYVVGNSCLKGIFICNADGVARASAGSLSKRMRTENDNALLERTGVKATLYKVSTCPITFIMYVKTVSDGLVFLRLVHSGKTGP